MKRTFWAAALTLFVGVTATSAGEAVPLAEATGPWLALLRSDNPALRTAAGAALADLVRKHPAAANDLVRGVATEADPAVAAEAERRLVALAKDSPATVSALIRLIREKETAYPARNFAVKVLSQAGPAAATPEFVEAMAETYCPVPGAYFRILRALGRDGTPVLVAGFRHANPFVRQRATNVLRVLGRTDPAMQKLFDGLQAEPPLLQKLRDGSPADRVAAVAALADLARTVPGTATRLVHALEEQTDKGVVAAAEDQLILLGRESPEAVAALVAGVRGEDGYRVRRLATKVLGQVGSGLNTKAVVEALGDDSCPVPYAMRKILLAAGPDAVPVLEAALKHDKPMIRAAAKDLLPKLPRP